MTHPTPGANTLVELAGREIVEAARALSVSAFTHYRKQDGTSGTIEGDDCKQCFIVPHDEMVELRAALGKALAK